MSRPRHRDSFATSVTREEVEIPVSVSFVATYDDEHGGYLVEDVEATTNEGKPMELTEPEFEVVCEEAAESLG